MTAGKKVIKENQEHRVVAIVHSEKEITIAIYGDIKGKGRPRFNRRTGHAYTPETTRTLENLIFSTVREAYDFPPSSGPVVMDIQIEQKRPKSKGAFHDYPKKPDCDNAAKLILDSLNELVYLDDAQVNQLTIRKNWTTSTQNSARVCVSIKLDCPPKPLSVSGYDLF